jgi:hypothetical protein
LNGDHISPPAEEARITAIRFDGVTVEVDYEGAPGVVYALDYSPDLSIWDEDIDDSLSGTGTATDNIVTRLGEAPPKAYYRLREIP